MTEAISRRAFLRGAGASAVALGVTTPVWYDWLRHQMAKLRGREVLVLSNNTSIELVDHIDYASFRETLKRTLNKVVHDDHEYALRYTSASWKFEAARQATIDEVYAGAALPGKTMTQLLAPPMPDHVRKALVEGEWYDIRTGEALVPGDA